MGEGEGEGGEHQVDGVHQGKDHQEPGHKQYLDELKLSTFTCGMFFGASTGQSRKHCKKTVKSVK